jgi:hypothetical protein
VDIEEYQKANGAVTTAGSVALILLTTTNSGSSEEIATIYSMFKN